MQKVFDESRTPFDLGAQLARGGEGVVWKLRSTDEYLTKIYHQRPGLLAAQKQRVLQRFSDELKGCAALPLSLAFSDAALNTHVGIFLRFVGGHEIHELYGSRSRSEHYPNASFKFLVCAAANLAAAFEEFHRRGILVGDVNEKNIKILPDATVRFIDCDSFQVSDGTRVFTSDVGTPIWTPPELHGKDLSGLVRSKNHDLFGLAQMIFLLLFSGRHPFSGIWKNQEDVLPEEAIRRQAYAYAPTSFNMPVQPPRGAPPVGMLPQGLQKGFLEAFLTNGSGSGGRPPASRWREMLHGLNSELSTCQHNPRHVFWRGASSCPWCKVVQETSFDIFPSKDRTPTRINTSGGSGYRVVPTPFAFAVTTPQVLTGLVPSPLPAQPSGFLSSLHRAFSPKGWKHGWLQPQINQLQRALREMEQQLSQLQKDQQVLIGNYRREFVLHSEKLRLIFHELNNPTVFATRARSDFDRERKNNELTDFLRQFYIRGASISQVGPARRTVLLSFGIETAANVTRPNLSRANMPSNAVEGLLSWRRDLEYRFKFDANKPLTRDQRNQIQVNADKAMTGQKEAAAALEVKLNGLNSSTTPRFREIEAKIVQLSRKRDQAKMDISHLSQELLRP
jgi:DNA-binding helix-hairpin-helix protein with protein kinase domain